MLERSQNLRYIQALEDLYIHAFEEGYPLPIAAEDLYYYIQRKKEELL